MYIDQLPPPVSPGVPGARFSAASMVSGPTTEDANDSLPDGETVDDDDATEDAEDDGDRSRSGQRPDPGHA